MLRKLYAEYGYAGTKINHNHRHNKYGYPIRGKYCHLDDFSVNLALSIVTFFAIFFHLAEHFNKSALYATLKVIIGFVYPMRLIVIN